MDEKNIVFLIEDLDKVEVKAHFASKYGAIANIRYTAFINEIVTLMMTYINGEVEETPR